MELKQRKGVLVRPINRLSETQIGVIDSTSRELLENPGITCSSENIVSMFKKRGAKVTSADSGFKISMSSTFIDNYISTVPSSVTLGARNPDNRLVLDAREARVRFASGAETNIWLETFFNNGGPALFKAHEGSIKLLTDAAHLCENLEHLDSFIRCVNIRDQGITAKNKDVNKFASSFNNITKHVQAGLTDFNALEAVLAMAEIIAGSGDSFKENPILSFIACVVKSPLQIVTDTAEKLKAIAEKRVPIVVSSSPMAGATAPFDEFGMVAQINAEILAGIILTQMASPGAPVLYGSVPVRTRLDNLNDMYAAPEFLHYNHDTVQMARYYNIPCYSTAGVADAPVPGIQATAEKMLTLGYMPRTGAQYIHYAFGLLDRTNIFSPEQAIMDNAHIGLVKHSLSEAKISEGAAKQKVLLLIREIMASDHKTYVYNLPLPTIDPVYMCYPLENEKHDALKKAHDIYRSIKETKRKHLSPSIKKDLLAKIPGLLSESLI